MTKARPHVAIVAASLDIVGGQAVQAHSLCERLRADGWRIDFVAINPRFPQRLAWLRGVPAARTLLNQCLYLPSLRALRRCDVVQVFCASYWSFLLSAAPALVAARVLGKRVILNYHSGEAPDHLARWGALVHPWLQLAHEIVVPSEFLAQVFARYGYRARVIYNVVDLERFAYRERSSLRPALLSNRNLESHYRVDNTLRAFSQLRSMHGNATITVAGRGHEEARLRDLTRLLRLEGVAFVGSVAPARMPDLYAAADVFVNSSVVDNQPLSVLEAFATGVPVVSTATGGIANMVRPGETGTIVAADDPSAMAGAIEDLLCRPEAARAMARRAHAELSKYTWPHVRRDWVDAYGGAA